MPTLGRVREVAEFFDSIKVSEDCHLVETIVIDQNDHDQLLPVIDEVSSGLQITYRRSSVRGLSINRNKGIGLANGVILGFPDDDCRYFPDTLEKVIESLKPERVDAVVGRICDYNDKDVIRRWPRKRCRINKLNYFRYVSNVVLFLKLQKNVGFSEDLGPGLPFGASEDNDYLYRLIKAGNRVSYEPDIRVWHPHQSLSSNDDDKVMRYARGLGGFFRKNLSVLNLGLFLAMLVRPWIRSILSKDADVRQKNFLSLRHRWAGFLEYRQNGPKK